MKVLPLRWHRMVVPVSRMLGRLGAAREPKGTPARAFYDPLTSLPNRSLLHLRLTEGLDRAARSGQPPAVILLDLDNFRSINDGLGHSVGDDVLIEVGARLVRAVRPIDTVARIGGDEFAVVVEDPVPVAITQTAQRILDTVKAPTEAGCRTVMLRASAGIAIGQVGQDADELLSNADAAMYAAKTAGKGHWQAFVPEMHDEVVQRLGLSTELAGALERDELFVVYQPIIDLDSRCMVGAEALVRWRHPSRGLVPPLDFIPVAEESGLISDVGTFVLRQAMHRLRACQQTSPSFYLAVNVSPAQFHRPDFVRQVTDILQEAAVDPRSLVLEITETGLMTDVEASIATLAELRHIGVRLAIDDFGTGYSSISYLKRLPVDIVKIDRSLVDGIATERGVWALIQAIFGLISAVGLDTVAEGIESAAQAAHLEALGCKWGQGYYFARPLPASELDDLAADPMTLPQPIDIDPPGTGVVRHWSTPTA